MQDEVSSSFHIAIIVWMTGAMISVVLGVLVMSLNILINYSSKYSDAMAGAASASIVDLAGDDATPGAIVYSSISTSIDTIDAVRIGSTYIYKYNDNNCQNLMRLMTTYKNKRYKVSITTGEINRALRTVILTEVP
jgi:hypothetical protein